MHFHNKPSWHLGENQATDEKLYLNRRSVLKGLGASVGVGVAMASLPTKELLAKPASLVDIAGAPMKYSDGGYRVDEDKNSYKDITTYNNFYEFGTGKGDPVKYAHTMTTDNWEIAVGGHCDKPGTYGIEDVLKSGDMEERIYRHRCVEAWSMVIPWVGIQLKDILAKFEPNSKAKFVVFQTKADVDEMPGLRAPVLRWPYQEGLRMDEAMHPLAFMAFGIYGKTLLNQNGAPLRLVTPWKYGFKGIKSIVSIQFVEDMPETSWKLSRASEYGFYSNVNPDVDHPRWTQASERRIGEFRRRKTLMFNGYAEEVASLYAGMDLFKNY
jgi:sulfoxide reductase catalytic subunit YedY